MDQLDQREPSLFDVLLPDGHELWPDWLRRIDSLLDEEAVIDTLVQALEARWPSASAPRAPQDAGRARSEDTDSEASLLLELSRYRARGACQIWCIGCSRALLPRGAGGHDYVEDGAGTRSEGP
jgi:hypothetical protein